MSLQTIKRTTNSSSQQTTCNSRQDDNQNSGRSGESPNYSRQGTDNQRSAIAIKGSRSYQTFEQASCSVMPSSAIGTIQQYECNYMFDHFSQLFSVKFDKIAEKPKDVQAQKSLIFMFEAIALQDKQRSMQQTQKTQQSKQIKNINININNQSSENEQNSVNKDEILSSKIIVGNKPTFNTRAQRDAYFAEQINQKNAQQLQQQQQQQQQSIDTTEGQKINVLQQINNQKQLKFNLDENQQQQQLSSSSRTQSPLTDQQITGHISTLPSVAQRVPKKRNLSIAVTSPSNGNGVNQNNSNLLIGGEQKHKRENSTNLKYLETHQTLTINQDKENYYNTEICGQFNGRSTCNKNSNNCHLINNNLSINHHQRSKSNISYINLQQNSSSLTNYSVNNTTNYSSQTATAITTTQTNFFQNSLNNGQAGSKISAKNNNSFKNCFQQSYTSCNNPVKNLNKLDSKGNSKRKIVKISSKSQQSQHTSKNTIQVNNTMINQDQQDTITSQNNISNYNLQPCNNTLLSINAEGSKSLQNTQPISKKSFSGISEDLFQLNAKNPTINTNKENLNINRKISLQESTVNSLPSSNNFNLKTSKYIFNMTNKVQNPQRNSFLSSLTQPSQSEISNVLGQLTQKFQYKKNIATETNIGSNQISFKQQQLNLNTSKHSNNNIGQIENQNADNIQQLGNTKYNNKHRNSNRETSLNNGVKNPANLKALSKNGKFNIRTINQSVNNSTPMNSNNLYNALPLTVNEYNYKSCQTSRLQSYNHIPDIISVNE